MSDIFPKVGAAGAARQVRVGDAEREAAASALGEHFTAGRLDQAEFDSRLSAAYRAVYGADLDRLFVDLPRLRPTRTDQPVRRGGPPGVLLALVIALVALMAVPAFIAKDPPVFLLALLCIWFVVRRRRRTWR